MKKLFAGVFLLLLVACCWGKDAANKDDLRQGLIHWWKFDGNADDYAGDLSATPIGPIAYVDGVGGRGIQFDGTNTGISLPPVRDLQFQGSFSITAWAKLYSYAPWNRIWSTIIFCGDDRAGADPWDIQVSPSGQLQFLVTSEKRASGLDAPGQFPLERFVFIAATYDRSHGLQYLYEDGVPVAEFKEVNGLTPVCKLLQGQYAGIGIGTNNGFPKSAYNMGWNGVTSNLRIYNRPLSRWEVLDLYLAKS